MAIKSLPIHRVVSNNIIIRKRQQLQHFTWYQCQGALDNRNLTKFSLQGQMYTLNQSKPSLILNCYYIRLVNEKFSGEKILKNHPDGHMEQMNR